MLTMLISTPRGDLVFIAAGGREILRFKPDGTIEMGDGYTPTEAAEAFIEAIRRRKRELAEMLGEVT